MIVLRIFATQRSRIPFDRSDLQRRRESSQLKKTNEHFRTRFFPHDCDRLVYLGWASVARAARSRRAVTQNKHGRRGSWRATADDGRSARQQLRPRVGLRSMLLRREATREVSTKKNKQTRSSDERSSARIVWYCFSFLLFRIRSLFFFLQWFIHLCFSTNVNVYFAKTRDEIQCFFCCRFTFFLFSQ